MWPFSRKITTEPPLMIEEKPGQVFENKGQVRKDSFINPLTGYGTASDKSTWSRPNTSIGRMSYEDCAALYRNNGYARTYVNIYAKQSTRKGWCIEGFENDEVVEKFERDFKIYEKTKKALSLMSVFGRSAFVLITKDVKDAFSLREPLPDNPGEILNIMVVECREELVPAEIDSDIRSKTYKEPIIWRMSPKTAIGSIGQVEVHASRLIFFEGEMVTPDVMLENQGVEDSVFQASYDAIRNISTIDQSLSNAANELQYTVFKVSGLEEKLGSDTADEFVDRMKQISAGKSVFRMTIIKNTEELEVRQLGVTGASELKNSSKEALCAVTRIPMPIYFGQAPGGLNSDGESHRATWFETISDYQNDKLLSPLTSLYTLFFKTIGRGGQKVVVKFQPLDEPNQLQMAQVRKTTAEADEIYLNSFVISPEYILERDDIDTKFLPKDEPIQEEVLIDEEV